MIADYLAYTSAAYVALGGEMIGFRGGGTCLLALKALARAPATGSRLLLCILYSFTPRFRPAPANHGQPTSEMPQAIDNNALCPQGVLHPPVSSATTRLPAAYPSISHETAHVWLNIRPACPSATSPPPRAPDWFLQLPLLCLTRGTCSIHLQISHR